MGKDMNIDVNKSPNMADAMTRAIALEHDLNEIEHSFHLAPGPRSLCDIYYMLHWKTEYLEREHLRHSNYGITREGVKFKLTWSYKCQRIHVNEIENIALSFRRQRGAIEGYVIPRFLPRG